MVAKPYESLGPAYSPNYYRKAAQFIVVALAVAFIIGFVISGIVVGVLFCTKKIRMGKKAGLNEAPQQKTKYGATDI